MTILKAIVPLQDQPGMPQAIARVVAESHGSVCAVCGLERMGHGPESSWLGFERHDWTPRAATASDMETARQFDYPRIPLETRRIYVMISNADAMAGAGGRPGRVYRALVEAHGHDNLCDAYGLDRDDVNGGTYWQDIVLQALAHGDVDGETGELT